MTQPVTHLVPITDLVISSIYLAERVKKLSSYLPYWDNDLQDQVSYKETQGQSTLWFLTLLNDYKVSDIFRAYVGVDSYQFKLRLTLDNVPVYRLTLNTAPVFVNEKTAYTNNNIVSTGGANLMILPHLHEAALKAIKLVDYKVKNLEARKEKIEEHREVSIDPKSYGSTFKMYVDTI